MRGGYDVFDGIVFLAALATTRACHWIIRKTRHYPKGRKP